MDFPEIHFGVWIIAACLVLIAAVRHWTFRDYCRRKLNPEQNDEGQTD